MGESFLALQLPYSVATLMTCAGLYLACVVNEEIGK